MSICNIYYLEASLIGRRIYKVDKMYSKISIFPSSEDFFMKTS